MAARTIERSPTKRLKSEQTSTMALIAIGATCVLLSPGLFGFGSIGLRVAASAGASITASSYGLAQYARSQSLPIRALWLSVPGLFWLVSAFTLGLASLAWVVTTPSSRVQSADVVAALILATLWIWATVIGFRWTSPRLRFASPLQRFDGLNERFRGTGGIAFLVGIASIAYLISVSRFSYVSGVEAALSATSSIPQLAQSIAFGTTIGSIVVLWRGLSTDTSRLVALGASMFFITGVIGLIGGMKEPVIAAVFGAAATYRIARGELPRWSIPIAVVIILIAFAFVNPYRQTVRYQDQSVSSALSQTAGELASSDIASVTGDSLYRLYFRIRDIDSVAVIIQNTPARITFRDPTTIPGETLSVLIPRSLWPAKPPVADGRDFAIEYFGFPANTDNAIAVTLVGDSYRYGGWVSTALVGLLLGSYLAVLDRAINPLRNPAALIMFVVLAIDLAQSGNGIVVTTATQAKNFVVTLLMMWFVLRLTSASGPQTASGGGVPS